MEPLAYLQIARRRWWLIVLLVIAAVLLIYVTTPARFVDHYEATHVVLVEGGGEDTDSSAASPEVFALWAKEDEVLARAAAVIGPEVSPTRLGREISVSTDRSVDTVAITAEDIDAERAALKANAVAQQTIAFLLQRDENRRQARAEELAARETELRARIRELDARIDRNPRDVETVIAERDALIRQLGDVLEAEDITVEPVQYTSVEEPDRGTRQERPIGTRTREQRMVLAGVVALVIGFGLAIVLDRSDTRIRSRRSAEEHFGLPVIAEIVAFPAWARHRRMAVVRRPDSSVAESFRTLRSALMLLQPGEAAARRNGMATPGTNGEAPRREVGTIMITSPETDDGKSTTVANLAAAFGESGQSVLVINFDLKRARGYRRSKAQRRLGISDYLSAPERPPLASLVQDSAMPGVRVVGRGRAPRPTGGRLAAQKELLDEARTLADVVILDTAPLLSSSLARELATMVDSVVALCRVGRTTAASAERCGDLLAQLGAPALGVVLVGVSAPSPSEYFGYFALRRDRRPTTGEPATAIAEGPPAGDEATGEPAQAWSENGDAGRPARHDAVADDG